MNRIIQTSLIVCLSASAMAQNEGDELKDYTGNATYKYSKFDASYDYAQSYTVAEENILKGKMESIAGYLKSNELISKPKGVEILMTGMVSEKAPLSEWNNKVKSEFTVLLYPWFIKNSQPEYKCVECEVGFTLYINRPDMAFYGLSVAGGSDIFDSDGIVMNIEPEVYGEQDGCKVYGN